MVEKENYDATTKFVHSAMRNKGCLQAKQRLQTNNDV